MDDIIEFDETNDNPINTSELNIINNDKIVNFEDKMSRYHPEWSNYVLNHLRDDEWDTDKNGNRIPKTDGLKRVVEELVGLIIDVDNIPIQAPCPDNQFISTIKSRVTVKLYNIENVDNMVYTGIADCKRSDCPPPYDKFVSAIAETRAEGRAYRKILGLKNTVTSEEVIGSDRNSTELSDTIDDNQIKYIKTMCARERLNLNIQQVFHTVTTNKYNSIQLYSQEDGFKIASMLNNIQSGKEPRSEDIGGFDANWMEYFG